MVHAPHSRTSTHDKKLLRVCPSIVLTGKSLSCNALWHTPNVSGKLERRVDPCTDPPAAGDQLHTGQYIAQKIRPME